MQSLKPNTTHGTDFNELMCHHCRRHQRRECINYVGGTLAATHAFEYAGHVTPSTCTAFHQPCSSTTHCVTPHALS